MQLKVALSACLVIAHALPALTRCHEGGQADRAGLCAGASPANLRGSNYIRLEVPGHLNETGYHSTFDAGVYNRTRYGVAFAAMQADGFNINRVFLDETPNRGIGGLTNSTVPLDPAWVDRLAQYISDAEAHGIYTVVTLVYCPTNQWWRDLAARSRPLSPGFQRYQGWNKEFISGQGQDLFTAYASQLGAALKVRLAPAAQAAVLVSLQNEFFLNGDQYPFGFRNISVTLADGVEYNMAEAAERQQAADANTNLWATRARDSVRKHLPATLVTVGVFTYDAVHKTGANGLLLEGCAQGAPVPKHVDCRFPARPYWLSRGTDLDFLDVHIYQADGSLAALDQNLQTEEWASVPLGVPVIMGEFGCNTNWGLNATTCVPHVRELQVSSCARGFSGWLFWTYDTDEQSGRGWVTMVDGGGAINRALSPRTNPDPCKAAA